MINLETKKDIRKELLCTRNSLPVNLCKTYSILIEERFFSLAQYQKADTLLIYASYNTEVSTYGIMEHALKHQKRVFCPKVLAPGIMEFYEISSIKDIAAGYKNIPEPAVTDIPYSPLEDSKTLMVMPLVGYDSCKNRLGYGGGFYDRYMQRFPFLSTIALGFECQRYKNNIPAEECDVKPNFILTETNIY